jgi:hypothetical protein
MQFHLIVCGFYNKKCIAFEMTASIYEYQKERCVDPEPAKIQSVCIFDQPFFFNYLKL